MKLRKVLSALLMAALLVPLSTGCRLIPPSSKPITAPNFEGGRYGNSEAWADDPYYSGDPAGDPAEPTPGTAVTAWDTGHALDIQYTPAGGLELPVKGATGYASVELYLWESEPVGDWCKLANVLARSYSAPATPASEPQQNAVVTPWGQTNDSTWGQSQNTAVGAVPQAMWSGGKTSLGVRTLNAPAVQGTQPAARTLSSSSNAYIIKLSPGTPFTILEESGDWWLVRAENRVGWVEHRYCLINLPDVIPSMVYDDTNSYSSVFRASYKDIPNITDKALYDAREYNPRLNREEFLMPVLYSMARKVCQAQQNALAEGNTIVLYEGFRPYDTQIQVAQEVAAMARTDAEVKAGISTYPWSISWFIATGISNHQQGYAMDVSLAKVTKAHVDSLDGYNYVQVDELEFYTMPTPIHELSMAACTYTGPVSIFSTTAWQSGTMTAAMAANDPAKALQRYCTSAGMTPLASEWWHFNDLATYTAVSKCLSKGNYYIQDCLSLAPSVVDY